ncbi:MAG: protein translocase subunit SecD, partial [Planctomycetaceae bacterium]
PALEELNIGDIGNIGDIDDADDDTDVGDAAAALKHLQTIKSLKDVNLIGKPRPKKPKRRSWLTAFRVGIDLGGGTNLVYQVVATPDKPITAEAMDQMVGAVKRRLDPAGTEEITVRKVGSDRIEVIIPRADPEVVEEKKRLMTRLGSLEFAMLANRRDHQDIISRAEMPGVERDIRNPTKDYIEASWRDVGVGPDGKPKDVHKGGDVVFRKNPNNQNIEQFLVVFEPPGRRVLGKYLTRAYPTTDENARPAVGFNFNTRGASRFSRLTGDNLPGQDGFRRRLAILLDDQIHSAPSIEAQIQGRGIIHGSFTIEEIEELVNVLNAGALALPFKTNPATGKPTPISEQTISPLLGADVQKKGKFAILAAVAAVFVFMLVYYRFSGVVANLCLVLNLLLVMGAMAFIDAAFTLPGLAGIVLTIGMAVDANVLIFERIREETARGSSLRMAIQNGFARAFTTIVDANLTTLITAVVLYMIGTDQVRGFAVTLFIGIVLSMFTALYFGRMIFDICERKRWIRRLKMNSLVGTTHWNFTGKQRLCGAISAAVIVAGLVGVVVRGGDLLDIDFSGGTMVSFEFKERQEPKAVKDALSKSDVLRDGMSLEVLTSADDDTKADTHHRFRLRGKEQDFLKFKNAIRETLKAEGEHFALRQVRITAFDKSMIKPIEDPTAAKKPDKRKSDKKKPKAGEQPRLVSTEFIGGHEVDITFSDDGLKVATFAGYVAQHLDQIGRTPGSEGNGKYTRPGELIRVDGIKKANAQTAESEAPKYRTVRLMAKKDIAANDLALALGELKEELDTSPIFPEVQNFDSAVAGDMQQSAILAMLFSLAAIVGYIWFRFQRATFGIAAVVALVHDVLVVLGVVALAGFVGDTAAGQWLNFKINLPMIAAFLTIVGYSLNDTIVVFDRVREVRGKNPALTGEMINTSLNQTLARTLLTSLTTFIVVAILYGWGGEGIRGFAFCLVLGVIVGTYSSIYVASPVLLWLMNRPGSEPARAGAQLRRAST